MKLRIALIAIAAVALCVTSCDVLKKNISTSGPQRFKAEVAAVLQDAKEQLENDGKMNPITRKKLDGIIAKNEATMGGGNSMRALKDAQKELDLMESDSTNAFQHKSNAQVHFQEALKALETEVRSDAGGGGGSD
jgi:hypothetical protein